MQISLDEKTIDIEAADLAELLEKVKQSLSASGRIVVQVSLDGSVLDPQTLAQRLAEPLLTQQIQLISVSPRSLAVDALSLIRQQLPKADELLLGAADLLQQDQEKQAMEKLGAALTIWQQAHQVIDQTSRLIGLNLDTLFLDDQTAAEIISATAMQMKQVRELIKAGDLIGLADSLTYEWPKSTQEWLKLIDAIIEHIERMDAPTS